MALSLSLDQLPLFSVIARWIWQHRVWWLTLPIVSVVLGIIISGISLFACVLWGFATAEFASTAFPTEDIHQAVMASFRGLAVWLVHMWWGSAMVVSALCYLVGIIWWPVPSDIEER